MCKIAHIDVYPTAVRMKDAFNIGTGFVGILDPQATMSSLKLQQMTATSVGEKQRALPSWSYETTESITTTIRHHIAPLLLGCDPLNLNAIHDAIYDALNRLLVTDTLSPKPQWTSLCTICADVSLISHCIPSSAESVMTHSHLPMP